MSRLPGVETMLGLSSPSKRARSAARTTGPPGSKASMQASRAYGQPLSSMSASTGRRRRKQRPTTGAGGGKPLPRRGGPRSHGARSAVRLAAPAGDGVGRNGAPRAGTGRGVGFGNPYDTLGLSNGADPAFMERTGNRLSLLAELHDVLGEVATDTRVTSHNQPLALDKLGEEFRVDAAEEEEHVAVAARRKAASARAARDHASRAARFTGRPLTQADAAAAAGAIPSTSWMTPTLLTTGLVMPTPTIHALGAEYEPLLSAALGTEGGVDDAGDDVPEEESPTSPQDSSLLSHSLAPWSPTVGQATNGATILASSMISVPEPGSLEMSSLASSQGAAGGTLPVLGQPSLSEEAKAALVEVGRQRVAAELAEREAKAADETASFHTGDYSGSLGGASDEDYHSEQGSPKLRGAQPAGSGGDGSDAEEAAREAEARRRLKAKARAHAEAKRAAQVQAAKEAADQEAERVAAEEKRKAEEEEARRKKQEEELQKARLAAVVDSADEESTSSSESELTATSRSSAASSGDASSDSDERTSSSTAASVASGVSRRSRRSARASSGASAHGRARSRSRRSRPRSARSARSTRSSRSSRSLAGSVASAAARHLLQVDTPEADRAAAAREESKAAVRALMQEDPALGLPPVSDSQVLAMYSDMKGVADELRDEWRRAREEEAAAKAALQRRRKTGGRVTSALKEQLGVDYGSTPPRTAAHLTPLATAPTREQLEKAKRQRAQQRETSPARSKSPGQRRLSPGKGGRKSVSPPPRFVRRSSVTAVGELVAAKAAAARLKQKSDTRDADRGADESKGVEDSGEAAQPQPSSDEAPDDAKATKPDADSTPRTVASDSVLASPDLRETGRSKPSHDRRSSVPVLSASTSQALSSGAHGRFPARGHAETKPLRSAERPLVHAAGIPPVSTAGESDVVEAMFAVEDDTEGDKGHMLEAGSAGAALGVGKADVGHAKQSRAPSRQGQRESHEDTLARHRSARLSPPSLGRSLSRQSMSDAQRVYSPPQSRQRRQSKSPAAQPQESALNPWLAMMDSDAEEDKDATDTDERSTGKRGQTASTPSKAGKRRASARGRARTPPPPPPLYLARRKGSLRGPMGLVRSSFGRPEPPAGYPPGAAGERLRRMPSWRPVSGPVENLIEQRDMRPPEPFSSAALKQVHKHLVKGLPAPQAALDAAAAPTADAGRGGPTLHSRRASHGRARGARGGRGDWQRGGRGRGRGRGRGSKPGPPPLSELSEEVIRTAADAGRIHTATHAAVLHDQLKGSIALQEGIGRIVDEQIAEVRKSIPRTLLFSYNLGNQRGKWAAQIAKKILRRLSHQNFGAALDRWKDYVKMHRLFEARLCAVDIQRVYRGHCGRAIASARRAYLIEQARLAEEARLEEERRRNMAAISIQMAWRSHVAYVEYKRRLTRHKAALMVQRKWRARKSRLLEEMLKGARAFKSKNALEIQRVFRGHLGRKKRDLRIRIAQVMEKQAQRRREAEEKEEAFRQEGAAVVLTSFIRRMARYLALKRAAAHFRWESALKIQCIWRCAIAWREITRRRKAARKLQQLREKRAVDIQRVGRGMLGRLLYKKTRRAKQVAERKKREKRERAKMNFKQLRAKDKARRGLNLAWRYTKGLAMNDRKAANDIQRVYRGHRARYKLRNRLRKEAKQRQADLLFRRNMVLIKMQRRWRLKMRWNAEKKVEMARVATRVQALYRGWKGRQAAEYFMDQLWAAQIIQRRWRGRATRMLLRALRIRHERETAALEKIFRCTKAYLARLAFPERLAQGRRMAEVLLRGQRENERTLEGHMDDILLETVYGRQSDDGPIQKIFQYFSQLGARGGALGRLDNPKFSKMVRESPGLYDKTVTAGKCDLWFSSVKDKGVRHVSYRQFVKLLQQIADSKFKGMHDYRKARGRHARMLKLCTAHLFQAKWAARALDMETYMRKLAVKRTAGAAMVIQKMFRRIRGRKLAAVFRERRRSMIVAQTKSNAATRIQAIFRARRDFVKVAKMLQGVIQEMHDTEIGAPYYYNPRTGRKTWVKPPMLGSREPNMQIVLPDRDNEYVVLCPHCEQRPAKIVCEDCEDVYCEFDYQRVHRKGNRAKHTHREIPECSECGYQAASRQCTPEQRLFCDSCFKNCHRDPPEDPDVVRRRELQKKKEEAIEAAWQKEQEDRQERLAQLRADAAEAAEAGDVVAAAAANREAEVLHIEITEKAEQHADDAMAAAEARMEGKSVDKKMSLKEKAMSKRKRRIKKQRRKSDTKMLEAMRPSLHHWEWLVEKCVQCEDWATKWRCDQCEDHYCTRCFRDMHRKGRLAYHTCVNLPYYTHELHRRYLLGVARREEAARMEKVEAFMAAKQREKEIWAIGLLQRIWRGRTVRLETKRLMKTKRRQAARNYKQRKKDDQERKKVTYKLANAFGLATTLKSDGTYERDMRGVPVLKRPPKGYLVPGNVTAVKTKKELKTSVDLRKHLAPQARVRMGRFLFVVDKVEEGIITLKSAVPPDFDVEPPHSKAAYDDPWGRDKLRKRKEDQLRKERARKLELSRMGKRKAFKREGEETEEKDDKEEIKDDHDVPAKFWKVHNDIELWQLPPETQAQQAKSALFSFAKKKLQKVGLVAEDYEPTARETKPKEKDPLKEKEKEMKAQLRKWEAVEDPESGRTYWYNKDTNETTWDDPEATLKKELVELTRAKEMEMTDEKAAHLQFEKEQLARRLEAKKAGAKGRGRGRGRGRGKDAKKKKKKK